MLVFTRMFFLECVVVCKCSLYELLMEKKSLLNVRPPILMAYLPIKILIPISNLFSIQCVILKINERVYLLQNHIWQKLLLLFSVYLFSQGIKSQNNNLRLSSPDLACKPPRSCKQLQLCICRHPLADLAGLSHVSIIWRERRKLL